MLKQKHKNQNLVLNGTQGQFLNNALLEKRQNSIAPKMCMDENLQLCTTKSMMENFLRGGFTYLHHGRITEANYHQSLRTWLPRDWMLKPAMARQGGSLVLGERDPLAGGRLQKGHV